MARTSAGAVTGVRARGTDGVDVHLLLGEERMSPGEVPAAGAGVLTGEVTAVPGSRLPLGAAGPGLRLERARDVEPVPPSVALSTVEFTLHADHDLLARPALFCLTTAADGLPGHFPGIGPAPLGLGDGRQSVTATFGARGFRAAPVTPVDVAWRDMPPPEPAYETLTAYAVVDRPFASLAVHRETRLVLAAGWVTDPKPCREDENARTQAI
ncbi:hypothetical protein ACFYOV_13875 [Streptomyces sp. NPDC005931]|uniref:hypothetical protein n=1 Tax=Streptomyces sp. NPDC005931 TaxID=3364737 RepID=UPI0036B9C123